MVAYCVLRSRTVQDSWSLTTNVDVCVGECSRALTPVAFEACIQLHYINPHSEEARERET